MNSPRILSTLLVGRTFLTTQSSFGFRFQQPRSIFGNSNSKVFSSVGYSKMAGVVPKKLVELYPETTKAIITALILTKTDPRFFLSKDENEYRGVITYTVRDSKRHIVNCKCWGSKEKIDEYHRKFKLGDVIDIICPRVQSQKLWSTGGVLVGPYERFQPLPSLPICLVLNEGQGLLEKHNRLSFDVSRELRQLLNVPHKPFSSVLNLADIHCQKDMCAQFVDLLVVVMTIRPLKSIKSTRSGEPVNCLELVVFDRSLPGGKVMTIWNTDWIERAQQYWVAMKTVLHLIDVKITYSDFYKSSILSLAGSTLVYENPVGREAQLLAEFAATAPCKDLDVFAQSGAGSLPPPEQIVAQMSVKQIYARTEGTMRDDSEQFTAVLYGMIIKFDIDGLTNIISRKCKSCQRLLGNHQTMCESDQCALAFSFNFSGEKYEHFFNIPLSIGDHTGTLTEPRMSGAIAERVLGLTVEQFKWLEPEQKEELKWRFLMDYFEVKLLIKKVTPVRRYLTMIVVDMKPVGLAELSQKMLVF